VVNIRSSGQAAAGCGGAGQSARLAAGTVPINVSTQTNTYNSYNDITVQCTHVVQDRQQLGVAELANHLALSPGLHRPMADVHPVA